MVAHACHSKKILFLAFFWKKQRITLQKQKQFYFRFDNTFVSQMFSKKYFRFKRITFSFQNTFTFVSETFCKTNRRTIASVLSSWPMHATLFSGSVFPLEKAWFAYPPLSMSDSNSSRSYCAYIWAWRLLLVDCNEWEEDV